MKKMTVAEVKKLKCMICGSDGMSYDFGGVWRNKEDMDENQTHGLKCEECGMQYTLWNLQVTDSYKVLTEVKMKAAEAWK